MIAPKDETLLRIRDLGFGLSPMSSSARIVTLNLGTHTVGLGEFYAQPNGGLVLNGYRLRQVLADPANESLRNAETAAALREMLAELRIKGGPVNYSTAA